MERNDKQKPVAKPDPAAEEELSDKAVEPHQPTYPPAGKVGETAEPEDEDDGEVESTTMERVNDALHRVRPRGAEEK